MRFNTSMKIQKLDKTYFGWRDATHKEIVETVLKDYPNLQQYGPILEEFVQKPDFDEKGFKSNNHFYFPPKSFSVFKSFLDISGKSNAYAYYLKHVSIMQDCIEKGDIPTALEHAGRAMHFLQDVSQPHHSHRGNIIKKANERAVHSEFETFAKENQEQFLNSLTCKNQHYDNFSDLFIKTANYSSNSKSASKENKDEWEQIAQNGINNAFSATKEFINKLNSLLTEKLN